ncbi:MAG: alpha/beta hydrolase [Flavisolibacter sp.]|nr:alpha/beta hydrolase [Flavisolibacter sp.]
MKVFFISLALSFLTAPAFCQYKAIKVFRTGSGSPILFLPGFITPGSVWNETIQSLNSKSESHIISYAGFNGMPAIDTPWYAAIKAELLQYIIKENLTSLTIIGHSMGGNLGVDIAAALPLKVSKLILVDALPCLRELMMPGAKASQIQYSSSYNKNILQMSGEAFDKVAFTMADNMTMNAGKRDTLIRWIKEADRNTYVYGYTDLLKLDLRDILKQVKATTLILGASYQNAEVTKGNFEKQYANLDLKVIEMANDSKHFIMFDQPIWFYKKVNAFLKQ